jgi:hypothetical protein
MRFPLQMGQAPLKGLLHAISYVRVLEELSQKFGRAPRARPFIKLKKKLPKVMPGPELARAWGESAVRR